jgi:hypothetical protein
MSLYKIMCLCVIANMITITIAIMIISAIGPQRGAVTHHQDHAISFVSFNTKNIKNKTGKNDNPELRFEFAIL